MMRRIAAFLANPVALKELRQLVRNRSVSIGLCLYMGLIALVGLSVAASGPNWRNDPLGARVFGPVRFILAMTLLLFAPLFTGLRTVAEMDASRRDVLFTTTLPPARFVDGKIASAAAIAFLAAMAALPFMVLCFLLRGISPGKIVVTVALCVAFSLLLSLLAMMLGAAPFPKMLRFVALLVGGFAGAFPLAFILAWTEEFIREFDIDSMPFLALAAIILAAFLLFRSVVVFEFSPTHSNRAKGALSLSVVLAAAAAVSGLLWCENNALRIITFLILLFAAAVFAFSCCGRGGCSRRTLAEVSGNRLVAFLEFPFFTGAENGMACSALITAIAFLPSFALSPESAAWGGAVCQMPEAFRLATVSVACYLFAYFGTAYAAWRLFLRGTRVPPFIAPMAAAASIAVVTIASVMATNGSPEGIPGFLWGAYADEYIPLHFFVSVAWAIVVGLLHAAWIGGALKKFLRRKEG